MFGDHWLPAHVERLLARKRERKLLLARPRPPSVESHATIATRAMRPKPDTSFPSGVTCTPPLLSLCRDSAAALLERPRRWCDAVAPDRDAESTLPSTRRGGFARGRSSARHQFITYPVKCQA